MKLTLDLTPETALYLSRAVEAVGWCDMRPERRTLAQIILRRGAEALIQSRWIGEDDQVKFVLVPLTPEERAAAIAVNQAERAAQGLPPYKPWPAVPHLNRPDDTTP